MVGVEAFFEGVVHGIDGNLAGFVSGECVEVGLLDEEKDDKEGSKNANDNNLNNCEAFFIHMLIIAKNNIGV